MRRFVNPLMDSIAAVRSTCPHRFQLHLAWASATAQSRLLDAQFPQQARERVVDYNAAMEAEMTARGIAALHYWNATLNAASSDGFHFMTDVNLLRANSLINYIALLDTANANAAATAPSVTPSASNTATADGHTSHWPAIVPL